MPFGVLGAGQKLIVKLELLGGPVYSKAVGSATAATNRFSSSVGRAKNALFGMTSGTNKQSAASKRLAVTQNATAASTSRLTAKSLAYNQVLFTARRATFYTTLAVLGLGAAVMRMGFAYDMAKQEAMVALAPVLAGTGELEERMNRLWHFAATTPFEFKDVTSAFRVLFSGFKTLGFSADFTQETLERVTDSLSYVGKVTPAALNRASVALQHMAFMGRPMGATITQLARDGLPIFSALKKELHLTDEEIHNIGKSGITARQVLEAFNKFVATEPGYMGAAMAQANKTLFGSWSTFKDLISQATGEAEGGLFSFAHKTLFGINKELDRFYKEGKPVTITAIAEAIDSQLTPASHAVLNIFTLLKSALTSIIFSLGVLFIVINAILTPFDRILRQFGIGTSAAGMLGYAIGILVTGFLTWKIAMFTWGAVADIMSLKILRQIKYIRIQTFTSIPANIRAWHKLAMAEGKYLSGGVWQKYNKLNTFMARMYRGLINAAKAMWLFTKEVWKNRIAILTHPLFWIPALIIAIIAGLVLLYYKWDWFHDLVNSSAAFLRDHWEWFLLAMGPFGWVVLVLAKVIQHFRQIWGWIEKIVTTSTNFLDKWGGRIKTPLKIALMAVPGGQAVTPFMAGGGTVNRSGMAIVGEAGPELLHLPTGASVIPLSRDTVSPVGDFGMGSRPPEVIQLTVDRKVLAEVVAHARQDKLARR